MSPLLSELLAAHRRRRGPELADALKACGFPSEATPVCIWGVDFVEANGAHYESLAGGRPACIVPVFEWGELVDLTATSFATRRTVTREGIAAVLGQEAIDHAKETATVLYLFQDPIEWLRNCCRGAVVLDWGAARFVLSEMSGIACSTELLARRVDKALRQSVHVPEIFVWEGLHREAA